MEIGENSMKYELKQYDKPLLTFSIVRQELDKITYVIEWINEEKKHLLPIGITPDSDSLAKWLKSRVIPKNREYVDQILSRSGLSHNDIIGIINICKGLSLNDSYWIVEKEFKGKFADYNLYQNNFTRTLALIAYTGYGSNTKKGFTSSPEYTTNGMLKKCWRRINGKIYLYKGGTSGAANTGNEPYSEYYASQIANTMGLNHIPYNLSKWKGTICSTCELFTNIDISFLPIYKLNQGNSLFEIANYLKTLGHEFYDAFSDMMIFDALICNTDRHAGNYGLLIDNKTNKPIKFAPIFDNGLSLFNYAMEDDFADIDKYAKTRFPAYGAISYEEIVKEFISERQKAQLRKLINFRFKKHSRYNLSNKRLKAIENFLQKRVHAFLEIKGKNE